MTWVAGVDGCRSGWIAALYDVDDGAVAVRRFERFAEVLDAPERPRVVAVDMPIGLLDTGRPGGRGPERELRRLLGQAGRASCVFTPPVRGALAAPSHRQADRINRQSSFDRLGLSRQSYNLIGKLAELDALMSPARQRRVFEAHPEFAFALMNQGAPLAASKKTGEGRRRRIELLAQHGLGAAAKAVRSFARRDAAPDDILDAAALARTALRIWQGDAVRLPARPPRDSRGLRMEIWG